MTISLQNTGRRFESTLKTFDGVPFKGTIRPRSEGEIRAYEMTEPRLILRVRSSSRVTSGDIVVHPNSSMYLLANYDDAIAGDEPLYRTHSMFPLNKQVTWQREAGTTDPLTGLKKGTGKQTLGSIWVLFEPDGRERMDLTLRIAEEVHRVITASPLQLGDIVDDRVVKKVDRLLGVYVAEIQ